ncbi:IclR family transcriptional regulator [Roseovarius ramblicola]|uniref:IclR family transcriptional regulator n=1 Tax=Roseovarius ramblicola TaxID=2022336 RepID=A0ABV5I2B3_9RHOB
MDTRNLALLEGVARLGEEATARRIADKINLPQATAYRHIADLENLGLVERLGKRYCIGSRLYKLLALGTSESELGKALMPALSGMAEALGETTFAARLTDQGIDIFQTCAPAEPDGAIVVPSKGLRPASICSSAKAILAHVPKSLQAEVIAAAAPMFPDLPSPDADSLEAEYAQVRDKGIAYCIGEEDPDIASVAMPVRLQGALGQVCVGIVGPRGRIMRKLDKNLEKQMKFRRDMIDALQ